jgi:hypothetical protein
MSDSIAPAHFTRSGRNLLARVVPVFLIDHIDDVSLCVVSCLLFNAAFELQIYVLVEDLWLGRATIVSLLL